MKMPTTNCFDRHVGQQCKKFDNEEAGIVTMQYQHDPHSRHNANCIVVTSTTTDIIVYDSVEGQIVAYMINTRSLPGPL